MASKTTIAVDKSLQKVIKKLAAWLDIPQGEVIRLAIAEYEKKILNNVKNSNEKELELKNEIQQILNASTEAIWKEDPKTKEIQQKLKKEINSLDEFILNNWNSGLEI
ncbi:MAG: ribbon-helix-helix domain-containing protein [Promethearchaeota archaeon]